MEWYDYPREVLLMVLDRVHELYRIGLVGYLMDIKGFYGFKRRKFSKKDLYRSADSLGIMEEGAVMIRIVGMGISKDWGAGIQV
jgi:hypothetical protein